MNEERIQELAGEFLDQYPLCEYFFLKTDDLTLTPEVKALCEQDTAVYGERRNVPPAPSSFEKCKSEIEKYENAFLFDAVYEVDALTIWNAVKKRGRLTRRWSAIFALSSAAVSAR